MNLSHDLAQRINCIQFEQKVKHVEKGLIEKEKYFRSLLKNVNDEIVVIDRNYTIVDANDSYLKLKGILKNDLIGKKYSDICSVHSNSTCELKTECFFAEVYSSGKKMVRQDVVIQPNGKTAYVDIEFNPIKSGNGEIQYVVNSIKDRTKLTVAQKMLHQYEESYKKLFENSHDAIVVIDTVNGNILELNKQACELYGFKKKALVGKSVFDFCIQPEEFKQIINSLYKSSGLPIFESIQINKKGNPIYLEVHASKTEYQNQEAIILSNRDISFKKNSEKDLKIFSEIINQSPSTVLLINTKGTIEYVNPKFTEVTGYSSREVIGKSPDILRNRMNNSAVYRNLWKTIDAGRIWRGEFINTKKNGEPYWASAVITPIINATGQPTHYLSIEQDVTDKKELEIELKLALNKANEISNFKSQLLGNLNHEVKTPLTAIIGYAQIIKEELTDEIGSIMSEKIIKSSMRLLNTLNSIIELSDLESDRIKIEMNEISLSHFINSIELKFKEYAKEKNLALLINTSDDDIIINSDENILWQVLSNIIENAIKYTESGKVEICAKIVTDEHYNEFVEFKVEDTGIGIPESKQKIIFEPFRQSSEGFTRSFEGAGLGLTISQRMMRLLNGNITLQSEVGKGSTFYIYLPKIII